MSDTDNLQMRIQNEVVALTKALTGLIENFQRLRNPLMESHEKVPQATSQLDKISQQTEAAAHRMLDTAEAITNREQDIINGLNQVLTGTLAPEDSKATLNGLVEKANTNLNDAYAIMDALQFQDITSQQMDHAASLLEEIEGKLQNILTIVGYFDCQDVQPIQRKIRAYDPHADMTDKKADQEAIDTLFEKAKKD
jgi:chemotaxis regulatin CheY-phosphate phosphatase CheZ